MIWESGLRCGIGEKVSSCNVLDRGTIGVVPRSRFSSIQFKALELDKRLNDRVVVFVIVL